MDTKCPYCVYIHGFSFWNPGGTPTLNSCFSLPDSRSTGIYWHTQLSHYIHRREIILYSSKVWYIVYSSIPH